MGLALRRAWGLIKFNLVVESLPNRIGKSNADGGKPLSLQCRNSMARGAVQCHGAVEGVWDGVIDSLTMS